MEPQRTQSSPEQQWNFHVWDTARPSDAMRGLDVNSQILDVERAGRGHDRTNHTVVGRQQFDGDRLAYQSFLADYARNTGGWSPMQDRMSRLRIANAAQQDQPRQDAYMRYISAGGTMNRSDFLRESGLSTVYGGY